MNKHKGQSEFSRFVYQLSKNKMAMIGLVILLIEVLIAIFATQIAPYGYQEIDPTALRQVPSAKHWFGTDEIGRDIFSRVVVGTRYSLSMGIIATAISSVIGIVIGAVAGFAGGWTDNIIMRALDVIQSLPGMLLTIVMSAVLGSGYFNTILALSVGAIPGQARMLRANMLKQRKAEYIEAAYSINCSPARIIFTHLVPNSISANIVGMTMGVAHYSGSFPILHRTWRTASYTRLGCNAQWSKSFYQKEPSYGYFPRSCNCRDSSCCQYAWRWN